MRAALGPRLRAGLLASVPLVLLGWALSIWIEAAGGPTWVGAGAVVMTSGTAVTAWIGLLRAPLGADAVHGLKVAARHGPTIVVVGSFATAISMLLVIYTLFAAVVAIVVGLFTLGLLGIPGLVVAFGPIVAFWMATSLVMPCALTEGAGPIGAVRRSVGLVWRHRPAAVEFLTLPTLALLGVAYVAVILLFAETDGSEVPWWATAVLGCLAVVPLIAYWITDAYDRLVALDREVGSPS